MDTILSVWTATSAAIKSDPNLLDSLKYMASNSATRMEGKYYPTGLITINGIFLGLDFIRSHREKFPKIVTNACFVDNASAHIADLSRVLMKVMLDGVHIANLTEDITENGKYEIYDQGIYWGPHDDYHLGSYFEDMVHRSVFIVHEKKPTDRTRDRSLKPDPIAIRMPIIDLEHITLHGVYAKLYDDNVVAEREFLILEL